MVRPAASGRLRRGAVAPLLRPGLAAEVAGSAEDATRAGGRRAQGAADLRRRRDRRQHPRIVEQHLQLRPPKEDAGTSGGSRAKRRGSLSPAGGGLGSVGRDVAGWRRSGFSVPASTGAASLVTRWAIRFSRFQIAMSSGPGSPSLPGRVTRVPKAAHSAVIRRAKASAGARGGAADTNERRTQIRRPGQARFHSVTEREGDPQISGSFGAAPTHPGGHRHPQGASAKRHLPRTRCEGSRSQGATLTTGSRARLAFAGGAVPARALRAGSRGGLRARPRLPGQSVVAAGRCGGAAPRGMG